MHQIHGVFMTTQPLYRHFAIAICALAFALPACASDIDKLAWMNGTWTQTKADSVVQESWLGPRGKLLMGVSLTSSGKGKASFEYMRIVETPDGLVFYANPNGGPAVAFALKESSDRRVVFENLANDFPHRVIYQLVANRKLHARIEGRVAGKSRSMDWQFIGEK
jgi:Domain of unknown function (DUF6265)